ncbi:MAG: hypothetical protein HOK49_15460, partial [Opitutae bacterium]|nr:hypothetical protein [Opitutae bacterium]
IDPVTGGLSFKVAPAFGNPTDGDAGNDYEVEVTATDNHDATAAIIFTVTMTDIFENAVPVITSSDAVDAVENQFTAATVVATDADQGDTLTYSLTGGVDAALFDLDGATGALTFKSAPDFESPAATDGNNTYVVEITVGDGTDTALQTLTVTVGNLFAPLVETLLPGADNRLSGRLHPDGGLSVTSTGFRISGSPFHSDGDTRFVEAEDLGPDGGFSALVTGLTPGTTYYYQAFAINAEGTGYGVLKKFLAPRPSVASGPWGDAIPIAGSGWYQTAIGLVYLPGEQWAYHQHLGWVYVQGNSPEDIWLWMEGSGWYWTARQYYPYIYRDSLPGWVYLLRSIGGTPVFYNTVSGQVEYGSGP